MKKPLSLLLCISLLALVLSGCSFSEYDLEKIDERFTEGNQEFAFNIFQALNKGEPDNNILISPISMSQALTMAYNGAGTTTKEAMEKVLGFSGLDNSVVNESFRNLNNYLKTADRKTDLKMGNSIWINKNVEIKKEFIKTNRDNFNAKVGNLDFSDPEAVRTINKWLSKATDGKIENAMEGPISDDTVMYIINAIYFNGIWTKKFKKGATYDGNFTTLDGSNIKVKMMTWGSTNEVKYDNSGKYQAIRLPYGKGKISMYIIMPAADFNINDFINYMDYRQWGEIKKSLHTSELEFAMPKFKIKYTAKDLKEILTELGMGEAFLKNADFSETGDVYLNDILHEAMVEVNEKGTKAAAYTMLKFNKKSSAPDSFIVDHPFIFIINDDATDTILFMGKVLNINEE